MAIKDRSWRIDIEIPGPAGYTESTRKRQSTGKQCPGPPGRLQRFSALRAPNPGPGNRRSRGPSFRHFRHPPTRKTRARLFRPGVTCSRARGAGRSAASDGTVEGLTLRSESRPRRLPAALPPPLGNRPRRFPQPLGKRTAFPTAPPAPDDDGHGVQQRGEDPSQPIRRGHTLAGVIHTGG